MTGHVQLASEPASGRATGSERRRIVIATETFEPEIGGGEAQARILADELMARGYAVQIVTRCSRPGLLRRERQGHLEIIRVSPVGVGRWKKRALAFTAFPVLAAAARGAHIMLVSGFRFMGVPAVLATRRHRVACILKADNRGELSGEYFRAGLAKWRLTPRSLPVRFAVGMRNTVLRRAEGFVALSDEMVEEFTGCGVSPSRISLVPNAVDVERFRPASREERRELRGRLGLPDVPVAVYSGRLVTHKGVPELLRAWEHLQREGTGAYLVLLGEGGADMHNCEPELRGFVNDRGLNDSVRFAGAVSNPEEYLRAADLFAFPSLNDALPLSLIEAMSCALPVISTRVGAIGDFLVDGENGVVVEPGDVDGLASALGNLVAGRTDGAALGRAARTTAVSRFSHHAVVDAYERLFEAVRKQTAEGR